MTNSNLSTYAQAIWSAYLDGEIDAEQRNARLKNVSAWAWHELSH